MWAPEDLTATNSIKKRAGAGIVLKRTHWGKEVEAARKNGQTQIRIRRVSKEAWVN